MTKPGAIRDWQLHKGQLYGLLQEAEHVVRSRWDPCWHQGLAVLPSSLAAGLLVQKEAKATDPALQTEWAWAAFPAAPGGSEPCPALPGGWSGKAAALPGSGEADSHLLYEYGCVNAVWEGWVPWETFLFPHPDTVPTLRKVQQGWGQLQARNRSPAVIAAAGGNERQPFKTVTDQRCFSFLSFFYFFFSQTVYLSLALVLFCVSS